VNFIGRIRLLGVFCQSHCRPSSQSKRVLRVTVNQGGHRGGCLDCCGRAGQPRFRRSRSPAVASLADTGGRRHVTADTGRAWRRMPRAYPAGLAGCQSPGVAVGPIHGRQVVTVASGRRVTRLGGSSRRVAVHRAPRRVRKKEVPLCGQPIGRRGGQPFCRPVVRSIIARATPAHFWNHLAGLVSPRLANPALWV